MLLIQRKYMFQKDMQLHTTHYRNNTDSLEFKFGYKFRRDSITASLSQLTDKHCINV